MRKLLRRWFGGSEPEREQDRFARLILEAVAQADPTLRLRYDPERFELIDAANVAGGRRTFLSNAHAEWRRVPEAERPEHIARFAAFILDNCKPRPRGEDALNALLPVLRSRIDTLMAHGSMVDWPYSQSARPFCDTMLLMLAIDSETSIALVTDDQLAALGVSFEDALGIATAQLYERGNHQFGQIGEGVFVSTCGDSYDASRVLLPELIAQLPVMGNPVVIVEARSAILVTGSEDMDGLAQLASFAIADFPDNERAIALAPIELRDGSWQSLAIEPRHPIALRNLIHHQRQWDYGASHDVLQAGLGDDIYVANPIVIEQQGRLATLGSWAARLPTACPLVDAVVIESDGDFPEIRRRFDDVVAVLGPFDPIDAMPHPPRWLLPGAIDPEKRRLLTEHHADYDPFAI